MMLGEESTSASYWKKAGDLALANKFKGVIMMVSIRIWYHILPTRADETGRTLGCHRR